MVGGGENREVSLKGLIAVAIWIACGYTMIVFNKLVLSTWGFNYPFFLGAWHSLCAALFTQLLAKFTPLLTAVNDSKMSRYLYFNRIVPISLFFSLGLVLGNSAYQYISLGYIQMVKAITPVPLLLLYFAFGREKPSFLLLLIMLTISGGIILSSVGELRFTWIGFFIQLAAVCSDCFRVLTVDRLMKDATIDALSLMYYTSPISFLFLAFGFYLFESQSFSFSSVDPSFYKILILNGLMAFLVTFTSTFAIGYTSGLLISVCGPLKDILVIFTSVLAFASPVTFLQVIGFSITLFGVYSYAQYKKNQNELQRQFDVILRRTVKVLNGRGSVDVDDDEEVGTELLPFRSNQNDDSQP